MTDTTSETAQTTSPGDDADVVVSLSPAEIITLFGATDTPGCKLLLALIGAPPIGEESQEAALATIEGISVSGLMFRALLIPNEDGNFDLAPQLASIAQLVADSEAWLRVSVPSEGRILLIGVSQHGVVSVRPGVFGIRTFSATAEDELLEASDAMLESILSVYAGLDGNVELGIEAFTPEGAERIILARDGEHTRVTMESSDEEIPAEELVTAEALEVLLGEFIDEYFSDVDEVEGIDG